MQIDHTIPWTKQRADAGEQQSRIGNYGPMVGFHHRIKTHGGWAVRQPFPGLYVWRDPYGATYLVDHTGTRRIPRPAPAPRSRLEARFTDLVLAKTDQSHPGRGSVGVPPFPHGGGVNAAQRAI